MSPRAAWSAACRGLLATALALLLAGCGSLPRIVPDMARSAPTPQIEGARGPLSAARSKQILDELRAQGPSDVLGRHLALEAAVADSPLVAGNSVRLLQDGPQTYDAMLEAIAAARDHVDMETYIMEDDEAGRRFAAALLDRQRHGVQVNLIYDSVGSILTPKPYFQALRDAGVNVLEFNPVNPLEAKVGWDVNQRDHRKLLVTDGRVAILGGINISSVYSGGSSAPRRPSKQNKSGLPWRDIDLRIEGPVVAEFQKIFMDTWQKQKGAALAARDYFPSLSRQGDEVVHALAGAPEDAYSPIYATLISAIDSAEQEVLLTNAYFVPDPQLVTALKAAVARGVTVKLIVPSQTDSALVFYAGRASYDDLLRGGVQIYERQNALLHAKTVLIDGVWSTVGSTNLDWRSFLHNQEINAVVLGVDFGRRMRESFDADMAQSRQLTLEAWERRSPAQRIKESFARMWQYWL